MLFDGWKEVSLENFMNTFNTMNISKVKGLLKVVLVRAKKLDQS